jgi:endonuclease-3
VSVPASDPERAAAILDALVRSHPDARVELDFETPLQLLIATILSAQSTDKRVNLVTPELFERFPDAAALAGAELGVLEEMIRSTGFFRQKAKSIRNCCRILVDEHDGEVPVAMDALTSLPGVGRKTANVVRAAAFGEPGIAVDTHCKRLSNRLELTAQTDPVKIEADLGELYPRSRWAEVSKLFVWHGRYVCKARRPLCGDCALIDLCPWAAANGAGS